jgi:hypothetical protein
MTAEERTRRKNAWIVISQALPHRTPKSVWAYATRVLHEGNYLVQLHPEIPCLRLNVALQQRAWLRTAC